MIESRDYYFLIHEGADGVRRRVQFTAIHSSTSCEGVASSTEFDDHTWSDKSVRALAIDRMKDRVIEHLSDELKAANRV